MKTNLHSKTDFRHLRLTAGIVCLVLGGLASARAADPPVRADGAGQPRVATDGVELPMTTELKKASPADFEATFLALMIHHHQMGAKMWMLANERATDDTIRTMENKTTKKEKIEVEQMSAWLKKYHGKNPSDLPPPSAATAMLTNGLEELSKAPPVRFNALFAQQMALHHLDAISMSRLAIQKVSHPEVKELARNIANTHSKDRKKLQGIAKTAK